GSDDELGAFFHAEASRSLAVATIARWWNGGLGDLRSPPARGRGGYVNRNSSKQTGGGLAPSGLFFFQLFLELSPCFDRRPIVLH
ncbi:MAG: hypothetical protein ACKN81_14915, partial [Pirellulaceae bacterium]